MVCDVRGRRVQDAMCDGTNRPLPRPELLCCVDGVLGNKSTRVNAAFNFLSVSEGPVRGHSRRHPGQTGPRQRHKPRRNPTERPLGITLPISPTMTLRNAARSLAPALRRLAYRQTRTVSPRQFSASAHNAPKSSDTPWMVRVKHPFSFIMLSSARAHRSGLRLSSFRRSDFRHRLPVMLTMHNKPRSRSDICWHLLRTLIHIIRTALLVMDSPVLLQRTHQQRLHLHLQSRPRYTTSAHLVHARVVSMTRRV